MRTISAVDHSRRFCNLSSRCSTVDFRFSSDIVSIVPLVFLGLMIARHQIFIDIVNMMIVVGFGEPGQRGLSALCPASPRHDPADGSPNGHGNCTKLNLFAWIVTGPETKGGTRYCFAVDNDMAAGNGLPQRLALFDHWTYKTHLSQLRFSPNHLPSGHLALHPRATHHIVE